MVLSLSAFGVSRYVAGTKSSWWDTMPVRAFL